MKKQELSAILATGIRRARRRLGLTLERLAEAADLDAGYLAHIETGAKTPSLAALAKIVDGLKVGPEELFRRDPKRKASELAKYDPVEKRLQAHLRGLSRGEKGDLLAVLGKLRDADQVKGLRRLLRA